MDATPWIRRLELQGETLARAFDGLSAEEARWRPAEGRWAPVEILGHLVDEERGDFRPRIERTLADPAAPWPPIDPEGWVRERRHRERRLGDLLGELRAERAASVAWLRELDAPDWGLAHDHPLLGALRAGDLLVSWAAHDLLHLRQLATTRIAWLERTAPPWSPGYALP